MRRQQQGAALILAILVVALATTLAVFMAGQQSMWTQQVGNLAARSQTQALARAAIDWARGVLAEDGRTNKVDHLGEPWARRLGGLPITSATISGAVYDQQALFNLNNLIRNGQDSEADIAFFQRLLRQLQLPQDLSNSLRDWIDEDSAVHLPSGAEDAEYLRGDPAFRSANRPLLSVDELYRVRGFNPAQIARLRPFVTALPQPSPINVNTAPREILLALLPDLAETDISTLLEQRRMAFFKSKQDFRSRLPQVAPTLRDESFDVASNYFLAMVQVRSELADTAYVALLARSTQSNWPKLVWQQQLAE